MIKRIFTKRAPEAIGPYSQAIEIKPFLFTSGQISLNDKGELIQGDIRIQTEQVFKNLTAILEESGLSLDDVVKVTVYMKDLNEFEQMNEVYASYFKDHRPARSTIEVSRLPKDVKVEIEMTAYKS